MIEMIGEKVLKMPSSILLSQNIIRFGTTWLASGSDTRQTIKPDSAGEAQMSAGYSAADRMGERV
jgi:hypothetical protein